MARAALLFLTIAGGAALLAFRPIYEPDLWWHLAQGREHAHGRVVATNVFSATAADYRQQYTPWLYEAAAYGAWRAGGGAGIQALQAVLLSLAFGLLYLASRARAPAWSAAAVLLVGIVLIEPRAIPRPHVVSFAGLAACALIVEQAAARRSPRVLLWAVPVVALWSNLHVECVFGVALIGLFAAGQLVHPTALDRRGAAGAMLIAAGCGLATLANPYGWGLLAYLHENISVPQIVSIAELRPPYLPDYRAFYFYLAAASLLLLSQPRKIALSDLLVLAAFGTLGAMHLRLTPLVLLGTAPMVAARLGGLPAWGVDRRAAVITAGVAALALSRIPPALLATGFAVGKEAVEPPQFFSRHAVAYIERAGLKGPVFNSHNLGGYLAWTLYPDVRIFQDSRLQAYPPEHFRSIIRASGSQEAWNALVAGVDWAVLSVPRPNQLSGAGRFPERDWRTVFRDQAMEVVVRRSGRYADVPGADGM